MFQVILSKWIKDLEEENRINKINIKQAIDIVGEAWDAIKEETIKNCWKKTKILPPNKTVEITDDPTSNDILGLISGLREVNIDHAMTAEEFVNVDSDITTTELPTDENIIEDILISEEGKKVLEITKKFLEQQEFATEKDVRYVNELIKRLNSSVDKAKRQSLLTEFMNIDIE
ncbi:15263_t:CDS:2 [Entrophospora sp. SA101]|nr:15263_t:CDS:2 [Entrophospora sp. SA101]